MFRDDYKKELNKLTLSDEFKQQTVELMKQKPTDKEVSAPVNNTVKFPLRPFRRITATAIILIAIALAAGTYFIGDFLIVESDGATMEGISAENEHGATAHDNVAAGQRQEADPAPAEVVYTINDAEYLITDSAPDRVEYKQDKIAYNTQNTGGFGYEGYNCYNISELDHNPTYTVGDEFETLPVYEFIPLSPQDAVENVEYILNSIDIELPDTKITWSKPLYTEEGHHYTNEEVVTYDTASPGNEYTMNYINGEITSGFGDTGEFSLWATRGQMRISFDSNLSDINKTASIFAGVEYKYPGLLDFENAAIYSWHDYTYRGAMNRYLYAYQASDDYGENLFNATVNNISISQVKQYEEDVKPTKTYFWVSLPYYTRKADLPAITYQQALGLLFSGQFYSSYTDTISENIQIVHIDMTYLPPEYNMEIPGYEGYSVPFYKFYARIPDSERTTLGGILNEYYVYYVCAIHPDYIQLDEDYYKFN